MKLFYGTLTKSVNTPAVDAGKYLHVEGFASTSSKDVEGDIILSKGLNVELPVKLLAHHKKDMPIGEVYDAVQRDNGLYIQAKIPLDSNLDYVNTMTKQIQAGLVSGFSVGVLVKKSIPIDSGVLVSSAELTEVSCVALPANREATITLVRSLFGDNEEDSLPNTKDISSIKTKAVSAIIAARRLTKGN